MPDSLLKTNALSLIKNRQFYEALPLCEKLWESEKSLFSGILLSRCLRLSRKFAECKQFHETFRTEVGNYLLMNIEKRFLYLHQYIIHREREDFIEVGEAILKFSSRYPEKTKLLQLSTILGIVRRLNDPKVRIKWLERLDHSMLDNNVFRFNHITYPSYRKQYFVEYAAALKDSDRVEDYIRGEMETLGFSGDIQKEFIAYMLTGVKSKDVYGSSHINITKLAQLLKNLSDEKSLRLAMDQQIIFSEGKKISVSELSQFSFCPVSYAISRTFQVYRPENWNKDDQQIVKKYLGKRYREAKKNKALKTIFNDFNFQMNIHSIKKFAAIFESNMETDNVTAAEPTIFLSDSGTITGAPDYIFAHPNGKRYVLVEKFSYGPGNSNREPFESDLVKLHAYQKLFSQKSLHFGLLLNWNYTIEKDSITNDRKLEINSFTITKVKVDQNSDLRLHQIIREVEYFNKKKQISVDGKSLAKPAKCLNCSVASYCHHKTGNYSTLSVPYEVLSIPMTPL